MKILCVQKQMNLKTLRWVKETKHTYTNTHCSTISCKWSLRKDKIAEGNGNPLQYSCLENSMDGGAWWALVHGVVKSQTRLNSFTCCCCVHRKAVSFLRYLASLINSNLLFPPALCCKTPIYSSSSTHLLMEVSQSYQKSRLPGCSLILPQIKLNFQVVQTF